MSKKRKKKTKTTTIVSRIILGIYLILTLILLGIVLSMNVLPTKYLVPVLLGYFGITLIFGLFAWKNNFKNWIKIIADIILTLIIVGSCFGLYYLNSTLNLLDKIKSKDYQLEDYYVLVRDDSKYNLIQDIDGMELGIYETREENYQSALEEVEGKIDIDSKEYENFTEEANALLDEEVDAILISAVHKAMVEDTIEDFESEVRIIYTVSIKVKNETVAKEADVTEESFNIYISGIDIYGDISSVSRSDVNIVATVNPNTHKVLLTTIPRDYYVQLHGTTGYRDKLTHAGIYGIDMSVTTIEDLLDTDINYYVRVNFTTLIELVDAIGGIDVESDYSFRAVSGEYFKKGTNHLNGKQALAFSRERKAFSDGDRQRGKNQQKVITAILNKALSSKTLITKYTNILDSLGGSFQTNMPTNKIYSLVNMQLDKMPSWEIESISLNGSDSHNYTYSYPGESLYVMEPDQQSVLDAIAKIKEIESGNTNTSE